MAFNGVLSREEVAANASRIPAKNNYERVKGDWVTSGHKLTGRVWYKYAGFTCCAERDFDSAESVVQWVKSAPVDDLPTDWQRKRWYLA